MQSEFLLFLFEIVDVLRCAYPTQQLRLICSYMGMALWCHPTHNIILYGGVYLCVKCGSTAMNKIQNLKFACPGLALVPEKELSHQHSHGEANIKRYNKGRGPLGFPEWPYNKFEVSHDTVMNNINGQLGGISAVCPAPLLLSLMMRTYGPPIHTLRMHCDRQEIQAQSSRIQEYNCMRREVVKCR